MSLIVPTIPDDAAQLAPWLERQLVGLDLVRLVGELHAIHKPAAREQAPVTDLLAGHLDRIYTQGLGGVPRKVLRHLLTHPGLLLQLQELILENGGPFWDECGHDYDAMNTHVESGRHRLGTLVRTILPQRTERASRSVWLPILAMAAVVLIGLVSWNLLRPTPQSAGATWGWDKPGALAKNVSREVYLNGLADSAQEWFNKRPDTAVDLGRRIAQFRQGCTTLLLSEHAPLNEKDREWLTERCRKWATKLDAHLADLEAGKDVAAVRQQSDETVNQLIKALRGRAEQA
jgi:hypothetical protein